MQAGSITLPRFFTPALLVGATLILAFLPFYAGRAMMQDMFFILTMLALAQYWNLLAGYAGLVSVGQQAFVGIGAYMMFAGAVFLDLNPVLALFFAAVIGVLLAIPSAFIVFRLRGAYFAIGTWVLAEVFRLVFAQFKSMGGGTGTSLSKSIVNDTFGISLARSLFDFKKSFARDAVFYWLALILALATILIIWYWLRTRRGLALTAIRDSEEAASSVGVNAQLIKFQAYLVAAFGTALTGALIYLQKGRLSPDAAFSVQDWTAYVIFIVVIGGIGTIEGPIIGVLIFFLLQNFLADYGPIYLFVLGGLAVVMMLFAPKGLWGLVQARTGLSLFSFRRHFSVTAEKKGGA